MNISVFGGSQPQEGSPAYQDALELGRMLAEKGYTVLTGGYMGTMEAVSRGASEAGGHVIGVTCEQIEKWRALGANRWVREERRTESLLDRLQGLIEGCDAALALPGGPGTLAEISLMWNLMIIGGLEKRPLILIGDGWQAVFSCFFQDLGLYSPPNQRGFLRFAPDGASAVAMLGKIVGDLAT
ncbi:MAG TPA: LOG family protein [Anaerolineales bacterium]|nr:LOG family protein [Anaerolineales bacterium]